MSIWKASGPRYRIINILYLYKNIVSRQVTEMSSDFVRGGGGGNLYATKNATMLCCPHCS